MSVYENIPDNVETTNLKENLQYVDKDDYAFTIEIKNKKIHQMVYSILMIIFLAITYTIIFMKKPKNTIPLFLYILYGIFSVLFYLYYYKISIFITNIILLFYIPI